MEPPYIVCFRAQAKHFLSFSLQLDGKRKRRRTLVKIALSSEKLIMVKLELLGLRGQLSLIVITRADSASKEQSILFFIKVLKSI